MSAPLSPWHQADRAYQTHVHTCETCRAAGLQPDTLQRCPQGQALWDTYSTAGPPPHFLWLAKQPPKEPQQPALSGLFLESHKC